MQGDDNKTTRSIDKKVVDIGLIYQDNLARFLKVDKVHRYLLGSSIMGMSHSSNFLDQSHLQTSWRGIL